MDTLAKFGEDCLNEVANDPNYAIGSFEFCISPLLHKFLWAGMCLHERGIWIDERCIEPFARVTDVVSYTASTGCRKYYLVTRSLRASQPTITAMQPSPDKPWHLNTNNAGSWKWLLRIDRSVADRRARLQLKCVARAFISPQSVLRRALRHRLFELCVVTSLLPIYIRYYSRWTKKKKNGSNSTHGGP
jgi:hypothetical protein